MKDNYKAELEGNNLSYAEKLEEMMLNKEGCKDDADKKAIEEGLLVKAEEAASSPLQHKFLIRGHFDSIREMHYCQSL